MERRKFSVFVMVSELLERIEERRDKTEKDFPRFLRDGHEKKWGTVISSAFGLDSINWNSSPPIFIWIFSIVNHDFFILTLTSLHPGQRVNTELILSHQVWIYPLLLKIEIFSYLIEFFSHKIHTTSFRLWPSGTAKKIHWKIKPPRKQTCLYFEIYLFLVTPLPASSCQTTWTKILFWNFIVLHLCIRLKIFIILFKKF